MCRQPCFVFFLFFFLNDPATTEIYPLPLHDALPICRRGYGKVRLVRATYCRPSLSSRSDLVALRTLRNQPPSTSFAQGEDLVKGPKAPASAVDRKSTRLNSSHDQISYAVFCLKKKKT